MTSLLPQSPEAPTKPPRLRTITTPQQLADLMGTDYAPSPEQWAAISAPLAPGVVVAGAGSGKTTLMAARVVYLVATGQVRPDQVLGLTFTTKAAAELRNRIRSALETAGLIDNAHSPAVPPANASSRDEDEPDLLEPTVATYNAYASALLNDHGLRIGHEPETRVLADASRYQLAGQVVARFTGAIEKLSDHDETVINNLLALDGQLSEHLTSPDEVRRVDADARVRFQQAHDEEAAGKNRKTYKEPIEAAISAIDRRRELLLLVESYRAFKRDLGLMDFGNQIELAARLGSEHPEVGELERERFTVVLLDEYQDTSVAQAQLLATLFGGGHAVTAVGDPNQAIYGWRGASVSNILNFAETFPAADGQVLRLPLTVNRRSDSRILDVANALAEPLYQRFGDQVARLTAPDGAALGDVDVAVFETLNDELDWLADAVHATRHAGVDWSQIGVLTRDNSHAALAYDALTTAGVPVEIVGLSGLIRLPEVAEVVATLHLMNDLTSNSSLLTLLTGPRWAIGPRDLRLLGERAKEIAGGAGRSRERRPIADELLSIADGIDPAELPALMDALDSPGELDYSAEAVQRFKLLSSELRTLRGHTGEPLLDIVRRIIDSSGVDVELSSATSDVAAARRDNLDLFVKAVADFQAVDGDVTLAALLAYLTAEDEAGNGLDVATPTEADSVKLLTVHRSKGLEWHTVFLIGVGHTRFPSNRSRTLWTSSPAVLPAVLRGDARDLPMLDGWDKAALAEYRVQTRAHDAQEELRLGYVALTRAQHRMFVTSYCWGSRPTGFGPSEYQETVRDAIALWGGEPLRWQDRPQRGDANPVTGVDLSRPWPPTALGEEVRRRRESALLVNELIRQGVQEHGSSDAEVDDLNMVELARVQEWDAEIDRLLAEARAEASPIQAVALPTSLSATALTKLAHDPSSMAAELARPMPRPPAPSADFGSRFHDWVEHRFAQPRILGLDDIPGAVDAELSDDEELSELIATFEAGPFADRVPHAVEAPFSLVLAGQVIRGRIDAVYREDDGSFLVVDWKTNKSHTADPLQLAIYRLAWAELMGVAISDVSAAFHYVRSGRTITPKQLADRAGLERVITQLNG